MKRLLSMLLIALPALGEGLDHSRWDRVLKMYVTADSRVDYQNLKWNASKDLEPYLKDLAAPWPAGLSADETKAALINAYNALTVHWMVVNYPQKSIWRTDNPFRKARHSLNGELVSLDQIEGRLREMKDPRIHAALVCAARSCPPLRREAYVAERLNHQLDDNARTWLADKRFNEFRPADRVARVSEVFKWYVKDFKPAGGVKEFLARYAPVAVKDPKIEYIPYNWGLNDATALGSDYTQWEFYRDQLRLGLTGH
jgi:hypothetical protein